MKKKILLLAFAVLFSTLNGFAESDRYTWGVYALERASFDDAFYHFKKGADEGMYEDCYDPLAVMYAIGLGTSKNPQLAFKYLKLSYAESASIFWARFYMGGRFKNKIAYRAFRNVPRAEAFYDSENYNCKAFGQSPNIKKAAEYAKSWDLPKEFPTSDFRKEELIRDNFTEYVREDIGYERAQLLYQYAKKENDTELIKMLYSHFGSRIFEKDDAEAYAKTPKTAESLKKFVDEAKSVEYKSNAAEEYFRLSLAEVFKDGLYNQTVDQLVTEAAKEWGEGYVQHYTGMKKAKCKVVLDSLFKAKDWEKIKNLPLDASFKKAYALYEKLKAKMDSGSLIDRSYRGLLLEGLEDSYYTPYVKDLVSDLDDSRKKLIAIKEKESHSWNAATDINYMQKLIELSQSEVMRQEYQRVALETASTWTVETKATEMDAVIERLNRFLNEKTKTKVIAAYNQNAIERINTAKNNKKDVARVYALAKDVKDMRYLTDSELREEANKLYEKYAKKMQKLQK